MKEQSNELTRVSVGRFSVLEDALKTLNADRQTIQFELSKLDGLLLLQGLQLLLRHPDFCSTTHARVARGVIDQLAGVLTTSPAIASVIDRGWKGE